MRKINTSNVNNTVGMPIKSGSIDHLQLAYQEALTALTNSIIGRLPDTSNCYVLYGCVNTGSGSTYTISAGAIYYNGEIYLVSAASFTVAGGQTAVLSFSTTYYSTNADPVTFTDGVARNVHQIRSIAIAAATSGSGISDFANILQTPLAFNTWFKGFFLTALFAGISHSKFDIFVASICLIILIITQSYKFIKFTIKK